MRKIYVIHGLIRPASQGSLNVQDRVW